MAPSAASGSAAAPRPDSVSCAGATAPLTRKTASATQPHAQSRR